MTTLSNRSYGYELSSIEHNLTFVKEFENIGYVRYKSVREGSFYLDPSFVYKTRKNEHFVVKNCPLPPEDTLIEASVLETDTKKEYQVTKKDVTSQTIKYVTNWQSTSPDKIRTHWLTTKDDFLSYISMTLVNQENMEDIEKLVALYMVSSPQITNIQKGGANTLLMSNYSLNTRKSTFNKIMRLIPPELKKPAARIFYQTTTNSEWINPVDSKEVNIAYMKTSEFPVDFAIPFDVSTLPKEFYQYNFDNVEDLVHGYLIDCYLYQSSISENLEKKVEEGIYTILDEYYTYPLPYIHNLGSSLPKMATSYTRFDYKTNVTTENLKDTVDLLLYSMERSRRLEPDYSNVGRVYPFLEDLNLLKKEIRDLHSTGVSLTLEIIKKNTKVSEWNFDNCIEELKQRGNLWVKSNGVFGFIDF